MVAYTQNTVAAVTRPKIWRPISLLRRNPTHRPQMARLSATLRRPSPFSRNRPSSSGFFGFFAVSATRSRTPSRPPPQPRTRRKKAPLTRRRYFSLRVVRHGGVSLRPSFSWCACTGCPRSATAPLPLRPPPQATSRFFGRARACVVLRPTTASRFSYLTSVACVCVAAAG